MHSPPHHTPHTTPALPNSHETATPVLGEGSASAPLEPSGRMASESAERSDAFRESSVRVVSSPPPVPVVFGVPVRRMIFLVVFVFKCRNTWLRWPINKLLQALYPEARNRRVGKRMSVAVSDWSTDHYHHHQHDRYTLLGISMGNAVNTIYIERDFVTK